MKKTPFLPIIFLITLLFTSSCYKDKSNYEYRPVSDIKISGLAQKYVQITELDVLKINPQISSDYDTTQFEYTWMVYNANNTVDTISKSKNLSYPIVGVPANFTLMFSVKNRSNGLGANVQTLLEVVSQYSKGYFMLKETVDANTDIDFLQENGTLLNNILLTSQGSTLQGAPRSMGILYNNPMMDPKTLGKSTANCIGLITYDRKTSVFRLADMFKVNDHSTMFYGEPNDIPYHFYTNYTNSVYLSSTGLYSISGSGLGKYGPPTSADIVGASDFRTLSAPNIGFVYWDDTNRRILFHNYTSTPQILITPGFSTTNLNYNCIFMGNYGGTLSGAQTGVVFILFKDRTDPSKLILYKLTGTSPFSAPAVNSVIAISDASKMHTATHFASSERAAQVIYFVASNKLYYFDPATQTETAFTPQGLPADETITYISNRFNWYDTSRFDYLTIATYKNGIYKVYMYNMVGGLPYGAAVRTVSGLGKVKEVHHVTNTFNSISEGNVNAGYSR